MRAYRGNVKQALVDMERAQQIEPTTLAMNANVAMVMYLDRAYAKAQARLEGVLALDPRYDYGHTLMGRVLIELGDIDAALEHFRSRQHPTPGAKVTSAVPTRVRGESMKPMQRSRGCNCVHAKASA